MGPEDSKRLYAGFWLFLNDHKMYKAKKTKFNNHSKFIALGSGIENQENSSQKKGEDQKKAKEVRTKFMKKNHKM